MLFDKGEWEEGKVAGLQQTPPFCAWKEAFNCLVVKCFWLWTGVEQRHPHPEPGAGCAQVQNDKTPPEYRTAKNSKIHLCDITLHLAGCGEQGLLLSVILRESPDGGWGLNTASWALPVPVGGAPRPSHPGVGNQGTEKFSKSWACRPKYRREYRVRAETLEKAFKFRDHK